MEPPTLPIAPCDVCRIEAGLTPCSAEGGCSMRVCGACWNRHRSEKHRQARLALE